MQYDVFFWNIFENYGLPEAYMNYKRFSRLEEGTRGGIPTDIKYEDV